MKINGLILVLLFPLNSFGLIAVKTRNTLAFRTFASDKPTETDIYDTFTPIDKILFQRFALSVATEVEIKEVPSNYEDLIATINKMTKSKPFNQVNESGKNMLVRLFPRWLLSQYQWMFAKPFPRFSAWMNAWVTHLASNWLMGNSTVVDLVLADGTIYEQQELIIEKCRFLETAGCLQTCIHACKIPTQRFFQEEMALPVTLLPNVTDYSCRFQFGVVPVPLEKDPIFKAPCLNICTDNRKSGMTDIDIIERSCKM